MRELDRYLWLPTAPKTLTAWELAVIILVLVTAAFIGCPYQEAYAAACDPKQPPGWSASPIFEFDCGGCIIEYGAMDLFKGYYREPGGEWILAQDFWCNYYPSSEGITWRCPLHEGAFAVQKWVPLAPGLEYEIRIAPRAYDYTLGDFIPVECCSTDYVSTPDKIWCMPEHWECSASGCVQVLAAQ